MIRWAAAYPVAVVFCTHPGHRARSAFYDDDAPTSERCPTCGGMIFPPPRPDQPLPVEVRGL